MAWWIATCMVFFHYQLNKHTITHKKRPVPKALVVFCGLSCAWLTGLLLSTVLKVCAWFIYQHPSSLTYGYDCLNVSKSILKDISSIDQWKLHHATHKNDAHNLRLALYGDKESYSTAVVLYLLYHDNKVNVCRIYASILAETAAEAPICYISHTEWYHVLTF